MRTSECINELNEALQGFQGTVGPIDKKAKGQVGGNRNYRYADLTTIVATITPPMGEHALSFAQSIVPVDGFLVCTTRVSHASGQWIEADACVPIVEGGRNAVQDMGSAITYARRYSLSAALGLVADEDTDAGNLDGARAATRGGDRSTSGGTEPTEAQKKMYHVQATKLQERMDPDAFRDWMQGQYEAKQFPKVKPAELNRTQLSTLIDEMVKQVKYYENGDDIDKALDDAVEENK